MARHLILHIGLPKTGSTAIQRMLATRRADLRAAGICVPEAASGGVPQFLHRAARAATDGGGGNARVKNFRRALDAEITALPAHIDRVILSGEQCSLSLRTADDIAGLCDWLAPHFATLRVVVYLRRQDLHAASLYSQALRRGRIAPPDLAALAAELDFLWDYEALLGRWAAVFGAGAITPRIFERDKMPGGDVVRDFLAVCGVGAAWVPTVADINPSMNIEGQRTLLAIGGWLQRQAGGAPPDRALWDQLTALVTQTCPGPGWRADRAAATTFLARYEASNAATCRHWFADQAQLFDMDISTLPEHPVDLEAPPAAETLFAAIIGALAERPDGAGNRRAARKALRRQAGGRRE